ncbi:MAG: Nucleoside-diphosphate-sugar epimerase [Candidatus Giovannonibacteria bacterium GW2011_GWB1_45_9b]|uniref:NAD-dependent epimerase/dehydratase domain-containing protein n=5 Tax=Candidatus Giovannoniibacteriota TaxID=1752738 RepID=A0A1F5X093_9BACT|nr:MAG: Nucleoside-diphosphate-sugar epimerase [Candidatus Giovannonibacteria bacterium GW2011_GWA2_44_26]KKT77891.1 MAG: Nucleoside-diphosphate-sugar epimerase [Candidatus Giovannonibacteria bacterium GW2011_GWC2_44_8]KKU16030.1 MAG: Nucleoside-diphosphate-sugar epimerase [Candidatus Giovannonibacteria bacterium GW2011_GWB1_45_9b]OGF74369.1 MAG: hypothetical protein A2W57_02430 [Candidatus Giovannonibacteria bacterium RIFCSPHIGHO2_02_43_16]OGF81328.1 MAG: hypothetical protein A2W48_00875 [Cand
MNLSKTILFGGSGFQGPIILEKYPDIISIGRSPLPKELTNKHIQIPNIDDLSALDNLDFDKVIFLIGSSNHHEINKSVMMGIEYNVIPIKKVLAYLKSKKRKIKKFIMFTTILLYDAKKIKLPVDESQPINPYLNDYVFSKYLSEEVAKLYPEIPVIVVRMSNIYGPTWLIRPDLVPTLMQSVLSRDGAEVWSVRPERDLIYVKDAADAIVSLLDTDHTGPVNLGTGEANSVSSVVEIIEKLSGKKIKVLDVPVSGPMKFIADISLLKKLTGWKPKYSLEEGLTDTYNIMKQLHSFPG